MRYRSTRGDGSKVYSFEEALLSGYAPDGGLFVPETLPSLTAKEHLIPWSKLTFPELASEVLVRSLEQSMIYFLPHAWLTMSFTFK